MLPGACVWERLAEVRLSDPPYPANSRVKSLSLARNALPGDYSQKMARPLMGVKGVVLAKRLKTCRTRGRAVLEVTSDAF